MALKEKILEVAGGPHVAAIATITMGMPAVRFMVLTGFDDMTFVGGTMKSTRKVAQAEEESRCGHRHLVGKGVYRSLRRDQGTGEVHEDLKTKKKYWNPMFEQYFKSPDNPDFVVLVFTAKEIEYHGPNMMEPETWER